MHRRIAPSAAASIHCPVGQASAALPSVAQGEQQVSVAPQPQEHRTRQVFRVSRELSQRAASLQAVSLQSAHQAQQEPLAFQAWKE